ncbi:hypothetical protein AAG570_006976 [Ranatra chinensis]|uniref:Reverse transcriptase n=1 Tax=Ranatra chinensis TaxID=642074 RepID=A0ABD0YXS4_9HEMI
MRSVKLGGDGARNTKVIQMASLDVRRGTFFDGSLQILGYADNLDVIGRTRRYVTKAIGRLEEECQLAGQKETLEKTNLMKATRYPEQRGAINLDEHGFEIVHYFVYLGSSVNADCSEQDEIKRRVAWGNRGYFVLGSILKSRSLQDFEAPNVKIPYQACRSLRSETWVLNRKSADMLNVFGQNLSEEYSALSMMMDDG